VAEVCNIPVPLLHQQIGYLQSLQQVQLRSQFLQQAQVRYRLLIQEAL
jgi:hypothetical protein